MVGTVYIPNPSVMTITMVSNSLKQQQPTCDHFPEPELTLSPVVLLLQGNVTFSNFVRNEYIGTTLLSNLILVPGNNTVPMRSTIDQALVVERILADFPDGFLPVDIVVNSTVYNGQHLSYYEEALAMAPQHIRLNVGEKLKAVGVALPGSSS